MSSALNFIFILLFIAVIFVVMGVAGYKSLKSDKPRICYTISGKGVVTDVVTSLPPSLRKYIYPGCGDGEEAGWYFPVVEYTYMGKTFTKISMKGTRSCRKFYQGKKVRISISDRLPHLMIVID